MLWNLSGKKRIIGKTKQFDKFVPATKAKDIHLRDSLSRHRSTILQIDRFQVVTSKYYTQI